MLRTSIILEMDGRRPIDLKAKGLAKNLAIAKWIFSLLDWPDSSGKPYPCLSYEIQREEWPEGDLYFPPVKTELWVLGFCLHLN